MKPIGPISMQVQRVFHDNPAVAYLFLIGGMSSQLEQRGPMNLADATVTQLLIPVDDFERGVSFYRDVLGIPLLFSAPPQMAFFQCGAIQAARRVMAAGQKAQRGSAIYFRVQNI